MIFGEIYQLEQPKDRHKGLQVYEGVNIQTREPVIVKLISQPTPEINFDTEIAVHTALASDPHFGTMLKYDTKGPVSYLVTPFYTDNLNTIFKSFKRKFSLKIVLIMADQMIARLEVLHKNGFIHQNLKPDVFTFFSNVDQVVLFDFGMAERYIDSATHEHIEMHQENRIKGGMRYASLNAHKGYTMSRRDDMESIAYLLILLLKKTLPWMGLESTNPAERNTQVMELKQNTPIDEMCAGLPPEFGQFLTLVRRLGFEDIPDYNYYRSIFRKRYISEGYGESVTINWSEAFNMALPILPQNLALSIPEVRSASSFPKKHNFFPLRRKFTPTVLDGIDGNVISTKQEIEGAKKISFNKRIPIIRPKVSSNTQVFADILNNPTLAAPSST